MQREVRHGPLLPEVPGEAPGVRPGLQEDSPTLADADVGVHENSSTTAPAPQLKRQCTASLPATDAECRPAAPQYGPSEGVKAAINNDVEIDLAEDTAIVAPPPPASVPPNNTNNVVYSDQIDLTEDTAIFAPPPPASVPPNNKNNFVYSDHSTIAPPSIAPTASSARRAAPEPSLRPCRAKLARRHVPLQPGFVYIGRGSVKFGLPASKWQNPFVIGEQGDRQDVIRKFRGHLLDNPDLLEQLE
eukprot:755343-Heterocapsa_arctica.AAC.1